jgi:hypothetical protein
LISPGALEDAILTLLSFSDEHATAIALRVPADLFTNKINQIIATAALDHIRRYSKPPKGQLEYLLEYELNRGEAGKLLSNQLDSLTNQAKDIQPSFILDELDRFLEIQRTTKALGAALEALTGGDVEAARAHMAKAREGNAPKGSPGIFMRDPKQALAFLDHDIEEGFSSGIQAIDKMHSTPARGTMTLFMASTGKGKSWWCHAVGAAAIQHHLKVIHIPLENSEEMTAKRYIQTLFSLSSREATEVSIPFFSGESIDVQTIIRPSVASQREKIVQRLKSWGPRMSLYIKGFPADYLSVEELDLFLDDFVRNGGFLPDVLIIDYLDLMRIGAENLRIDTGKITRQLKGLAMRRNCALITPTQGNRLSDEAKTVKRNMVSEDWSKPGTADNVYTYSQTPEEFKLGLARISVEKSRNERDRFMVLVSQAYQIGQFAIDSVLMRADISTQLDRLTSGD